MAQNHLDSSAIRAVLEANRAKLSLMQRRDPPDVVATIQSNKTAPVAGQAAPYPAPGGPAPDKRHLGEQLRSNPVYGQPAGTPGASAASGDYAPKLAAALRQPTDLAASSEAGLPRLGDLFSPQPQLPLGLRLATPPPGASAASDPPRFAAWDSARPYLTGRFLFEAAFDRASGAAAARPPALSLESFPPSVQESLLVEDLLHAFDGLDGSWVCARVADDRGGPRVEFRVASRGQLEPALLEMAARMLPLCEYVAVVQRFVETRRTYEWGLVCQALAGAARQVLADWALMLAQLEHQARSGKLTLQALWYYVQPPMAALRLVAAIAADASARRLRGAALLDLLHSRAAALMGDAAAHRLALRLLRAAAEPYFAMLERWVCDGVVDDPYSEFMVQEDAAITTAALSADGGSAFWADRFTLRPAADPLTGAPPPPLSAAGEAPRDVPAFLARAQRPILDAGKYLNLVRSCGRRPERPLPAGKHLEYDEGGKFLLAVEEAHRAAAAAAMSLLRREVGLTQGLSVLKRYFLAAQGDLFLAFMDFGDAEMNSLAGLVPLPALQSLLDLSVRASSASGDGATARLRAAYDHRSVLNMLIAITQTAMPGGQDSPQKRPRLRPVVPALMTAAERSTVGRQKLSRESFMLSYHVPWPLSVVAPDSAVAQYQMVFRHLFELKWVDRELNRVCALYQATRPLANRQRTASRRDSLAPRPPAAAAASWAPPSASAAALAAAHRTCQLMTHFFRQYLLYVTFEVLEPLWAALEAHLAGAATLDEMIAHHRVFLLKVMKGLLLSRKVVVLRALLGLKDLALQFVKLSSTRVALDYEAIEEEVDAAMAGGRKGPGSAIERRRAKAEKARRALEAMLADRAFAVPVGELRCKFESRCGEFMSALAEAHRQARSERSDTREELEGLLNLMARLDFNGYFSARGKGGGGAEVGGL